MTLLKSPEAIQAFVDGVNAIRKIIVRGAAFDQERSDLFANLRAHRVDHKLAKEVARRFEAKDPMGAYEFDQQFDEAIEIYSKSLVAQDLLRARSRETATPIAVTVPPTVSPGNGLATAADSAKPPAAEAGVPPAAVPASPAKADDAILVKPPRNPPPVFARYARYKNGAFA